MELAHPLLHDHDVDKRADQGVVWLEEGRSCWKQARARYGLECYDVFM